MTERWYIPIAITVRVREEWEVYVEEAETLVSSSEVAESSEKVSRSTPCEPTP